MSLVAFGILRAAMFAEPAVTQIEEVRGLMHLEISDDKSQMADSSLKCNFEIAEKRQAAVALACFSTAKSKKHTDEL